MFDNTYSQNLITKQKKIDQIHKKYFDLYVKKVIENDKSKKLLLKKTISDEKSKQHYANYKIYEFYFIRQFLNESLKLFYSKSSNKIGHLPEKSENVIAELYTNFGNIVDSIQNYSNKINAELFFVYVPHICFLDHDIDCFDHANEHVKLLNEYYLVNNIINKKNIPFIDMSKIMQNDILHYSTYYAFKFNIVKHYNENGYQLLAKSIYEAMNKKN